MSSAAVSTQGPAGVMRGHGARVWAMAAVVAAAYAAVSLLRHHALRSTAYDLGIFHQAVDGWAHFRPPIVPIKGVHDHLGAQFDLLGDHFHPILALLAPSYWIWPHPGTLLVDQALILAAAVPAVWLFTRRALASPAAAYLVAIAFALYWGVQAGAAFDFHEVAVSVPLVAWALERMQAGRWRAATPCVLALLLVKEDLAFLVVAFGLYAALRGRRRLGASLAVAGITGYFLITKTLMPAISGQAFAYWNYDALGDSLGPAAAFLVAHPVEAVRLLVEPAPKLRTWGMLLLPWGLVLSFLSPILVLAVPLVAERFYSGLPKHWVVGYHYSLTIAPILALAAVDGLARVLRWIPRDAANRLRVAVPGALVALGAVLTVAHPFPLVSLVRWSYWNPPSVVAAGRAAVALIPDGARVEATDRLVPQIVDRTQVLLLDGEPHAVDWLVADHAQTDWPFTQLAGVGAYLNARAAAGWVTVRDAGGFVVMHAPGVG